MYRDWAVVCSNKYCSDFEMCGILVVEAFWRTNTKSLGVYWFCE